MTLHDLMALDDPGQFRVRALALLQQQRDYIDQLEAALKQARRWRFGAHSEILPAGPQRRQFEEDAETDIAVLETQLSRLHIQEEPPLARPKRQPLPAALPRESVRCGLDTQNCPDCGHPLRFLRDEITERLEYRPATFLVRRYVCPQYSCAACQGIHAQAQPAHLIEKGLPEPGLLAQVMVAKYRDHLPLYRQQQIYARSGVILARSTLSDWVGQVAMALQPLADALKLALLVSPVLHADETPLPVLVPGKGQTQRAYLWTYVTGRDHAPAVVYYELQPGRSGRYAGSCLKNWPGGTLVTDDYAGYNGLYARPEITEAGCWAHARRKFFDYYQTSQSPVAKQALDGIRELYKLERKIRSRPPDKRRQWRQRYARPWLDEFRSWLQTCQAKTAPNSGLHKAIAYTLKRWAALVCYLNDGRVPIDNNRAENALRGVAVGRKNWLFAGSLAAGQRAAMVMSLLETAHVNGHDPWVWLRDVLRRLPTWPNNRLNELLPWPENPFS
ncbi:IS66 family transposase [Xenorhabdus sp. PB62.4]|uniref:IS66 family transposase n=1 Tax=Xenorhabdus sp. PB62.4 TaxID=1851573 RepID=UPI001656C28B|nr:IS66 family transposase [Xenorhabdus sp. PB62.4]MBC8954997.1 transposase [Xenorhabdus sp. PB62.4]